MTSELARYALPAQQLDRILTPALVVYLDRVRDNLATMRDYLGGDLDRWRVHVKTTKTPRVFRELLDFGLRNFKCATTREARELLQVIRDAGRDDCDLLVAYPHQGPAPRRLGELAGEFPETRLSMLCEDPGMAGGIPDALGIFVDVNPGMNRTGAPIEAVAQILEVARRAGPRFRGVHFYEGHVRGGTEADRRAITNEIYAGLVDLLAEFDRADIAVAELVTSGSPSFLHALAYAPFRERAGTLHRVSPGTVVFHDMGYGDMVEELLLTPAALVLARIVSHPAPGIATCDAGSKSIAAEAGDPCARVVGHPELTALRPSEEHLPLRVESGDRPALGTPVYLVPRHVCPTVNLAEQAVLVDGGEVVGTAPVSARAHDVWIDRGEPQ